MNSVPAKWIAFLFRHRLLTFLLMGAFFLLFGFCSVNLFMLLKLNIDLFLDYGPMVIEDGALQQLFEIIGAAYLSMVFWVLFRLCERILVERIARSPLREAAAYMAPEGGGRSADADPRRSRNGEDD
jgi:hypothetical protein